MKKRMLITLLVVFLMILSVSAQSVEKLPAPPTEPSELPNVLPEVMMYEQPLPGCQDSPDANVTCSLLQGQRFSGKFTLGSNTVRFATGDHIAFFAYGGDPASSTILSPEGLDRVGTASFAPGLEPGLYDLLQPAVEGQGQYSIAVDPTGFTYESAMVWVVANVSSAPVDLGMWVPYGGFWGDAGQPIYEPIDSDDLVAARDLHIDKMLFGNLATTEAIEQSGGQPVYPEVNPANCADVNDLEVNTQTYCVGVNVIVVVWDGATWSTVSYGLAYNKDGKLQWLDLLALLTQSV